MILPLQGAALMGAAVTQGAALGYEMFFLCFATQARKLERGRVVVGL